jgi:hypothetical protein
VNSTTRCWKYIQIALTLGRYGEQYFSFSAATAGPTPDLIVEGDGEHVIKASRATLTKEDKS